MAVACGLAVAAMTVIFAGGALLTAVAGALYEAAGWKAVSGFAASLLGLALLVWLVVPEPDAARVRSARSVRGRSPASPATIGRPPSPRT